jgi:ribonuclease BN (tRNA processing enzyme)
VVLTHFHVDHCLDLFALFFALRNPALRSRHLTVVGPTGVADLCERMTGVFGDWVRLPSDQLQFVELQPGPVQVDLESGRLVGEALRMPHLGHSLGYRLQAERSQVAYSGDTGVGPEPVELGRDVDLYLLEAALPSGSDATSHLTPEKAGQVAAECGCGHLLLSHFYPETEGEDIIASVRRFFSGKLTLAQDQLSLSL